MYDTTHISVSEKAKNIFNVLLSLYPKAYRKYYGNEMQLVFSEMYLEELEKYGTVGIVFWFSQIKDLTKSIIQQHIEDIRKKGMKKYLQKTLHINKFNIIGSIFLLPACTIFTIDLVARIVQGDLVHYNRPVYAFLSHTPLYWYPVLFTWVILFPVLSVVINVIPLVKHIFKNNGHVKTTRFFLQNLITIALLLLATFFILLVKFHDFGPCMLHGIARLGFEHFTHIFAVCKKA